MGLLKKVRKGLKKFVEGVGYAVAVNTAGQGFADKHDKKGEFHNLDSGSGGGSPIIFASSSSGRSNFVEGERQPEFQTPGWLQSVENAVLAYASQPKASKQPPTIINVGGFGGGALQPEPDFSADYKRAAALGHTLHTSGSIFAFTPQKLANAALVLGSLTPVGATRMLGARGIAALFGRTGVRRVAAIGSGGGLVGMWFRGREADRRNELATERMKLSAASLATRSQAAALRIQQASDRLKLSTQVFSTNLPMIQARATAGVVHQQLLMLQDQLKMRQLAGGTVKRAPTADETLKAAATASDEKLRIAVNARKMQDLIDEPTAKQKRDTADVAAAVARQDKLDAQRRADALAASIARQARADRFGGLLAGALLTRKEKGDRAVIVNRTAEANVKHNVVRLTSRPRRKRKHRSKRASTAAHKRKSHKRT